MHGQDIPWLLRHWAHHRPDHPVLVWAPKSGEDRTWTYQRLFDDVRSLAGGLARRGISVADKIIVHSENCPEMVLSVLACAAVGAVAVTTNTKSTAAELSYFAAHTGAVAAITQPQFAQLLLTSAPALRWVAVTDDNSGEPPSAEYKADDVETFSSLYGLSARGHPTSTFVLRTSISSTRRSSTSTLKVGLSSPCWESVPLLYSCRSGRRPTFGR